MLTAAGAGMLAATSAAARLATAVSLALFIHVIGLVALLVVLLAGSTLLGGILSTA
jgi:hypothetical protein